MHRRQPSRRIFYVGRVRALSEQLFDEVKPGKFTPDPREKLLSSHENEPARCFE